MRMPHLFYVPLSELYQAKHLRMPDLQTLCIVHLDAREQMHYAQCLARSGILKCFANGSLNNFTRSIRPQIIHYKHVIKYNAHNQAMHCVAITETDGNIEGSVFWSLRLENLTNYEYHKICANSMEDEKLSSLRSILRTDSEELFAAHTT